MVFKNFLACQTAPPAMPGPAGMMNVTGQVNQGYPGQMSSMGQQPTVVSYMTWKICSMFLWSYT